MFQVRVGNKRHFFAWNLKEKSEAAAVLFFTVRRWGRCFCNSGTLSLICDSCPRAGSRWACTCSAFPWILRQLLWFPDQVCVLAPGHREPLSPLGQAHHQGWRQWGHRYRLHSVLRGSACLCLLARYWCLPWGPGVPASDRKTVAL